MLLTGLYLFKSGFAFCIFYLRRKNEMKMCVFCCFSPKEVEALRAELEKSDNLDTGVTISSLDDSPVVEQRNVDEMLALD